MTLTGIIEALGFGSARDAKLLVKRLGGGAALTVATDDSRIARALERAQHVARPVVAGTDGDEALALGVPDGGAGLAAVEALALATREGGRVQVATIPVLGRSVDRARVIGLFLRAGLVELQQEVDGGVIYTTGRVRRLTGA